MTYQAMFKKMQGLVKKANVSAVSEHIALQFNVEGDGEGIFYIEFADGALKAEPYDYCDHDAMISSTSTVLLEVLGGKKLFSEAVATDELKVEGNYDKALSLNAMFPVKVAAKKTTTAKETTTKKATTAAKTTAAKTTAAKTTAAKTTAAKTTAAKTTAAKTTTAKTTAAKTTAAKTTTAKTTAAKTTAAKTTTKKTTAAKPATAKKEATIAK